MKQNLFIGCQNNKEIIESLKNGDRPWAKTKDTPPIQLSDYSLNYSPVENFIKATGAKFIYGPNYAAYIYAGDYIVMPYRGQFVDQAEFFIVSFHELVHWSEVRLGWKNTYETNELIAEMTACYLADEFDLPNRSMKNHNRYLPVWLEKIESDPTWFLEVQKQSFKVFDYLSSFSLIVH